MEQIMGLADNLNGILDLGFGLRVIEWIGAILGMLGALILALNRPWSRWAWPVWLCSNLFLVLFCVVVGNYGIATMQVWFLVTSIVGCIRWKTPKAVKGAVAPST